MREREGGTICNRLDSSFNPRVKSIRKSFRASEHIYSLTDREKCIISLEITRINNVNCDDRRVDDVRVVEYASVYFRFLRETFTRG